MIPRNRIEAMLDAGAVFEIEAGRKVMAFLAGGIEWLPDGEIIWGKPFLSFDTNISEFDFHVVSRDGDPADDGEIVTIPIRDDSGKPAKFRIVPIELSDSFGGPELVKAQAELKRFRDMLRSGQKPEWYAMLDYVKQTRIKS